ncbi:hypothetical protein [Micromonospora sagamiensis]|uniref:DUF4177 domain-containing protein n=1 Tax=Micromonospora sagamiensis TaxID=47875 RepID=A0A562WPL6_9ACTN|nr:hypothetical protein [Micromonospora sagamiensis]TWJ32168.1 hypothetical protein JD81_05740 [Micromonospora sagamiensis]BCL14773.1 hypothetical protein GCM10017556_25120 [Micromonospora sagamiensis]
MANVTPQQLAQTRIVVADAVLRNEVDFRGYPHRHVAVVGRPKFMNSNITQLLEAVEYLGHYGWELVNITPGTGSHLFYAFLRRR